MSTTQVSLLPQSAQILREFLRGKSAKSLAETYGVKTKDIARLVKKAMAEYRVRCHHEITHYIADVDARLDMIMNRMWEISEQANITDQDKIKAMGEVVKVMGHKLQVARLLKPDENEASTFVGCSFVVVNNRQEKEAVENALMNFDDFQRITGPANAPIEQVPGSLVDDDADSSEASDLPE